MASSNSKGRKATRGGRPNIKAASGAPPQWRTAQEDRDNVLAFLLGMQQPDSCVFPDKFNRRIQSGRQLIGEMAARQGVDALSIAQCADVLTFLTCNESNEPLDWHTFASPSRARGQDIVLEIVERSLRAAMEVQS